MVFNSNTMQKSKTHKNKRISIALPEREGKLLACYAKEHGLTRPDAMRRILREYLREYKLQLSNAEPQNQLGLFDSLQIDIFNSTSKTTE